MGFSLVSPCWIIANLKTRNIISFFSGWLEQLRLKQILSPKEYSSYAIAQCQMQPKNTEDRPWQRARTDAIELVQARALQNCSDVGCRDDVDDDGDDKDDDGDDEADK